MFDMLILPRRGNAAGESSAAVGAKGRCFVVLFRLGLITVFIDLPPQTQEAKKQSPGFYASSH